MKKSVNFLLAILCFVSTYSQNIIKPEKGYTPQVGSLVSMLNDLSKRLERTVGNMSQKDIDFLMDENSNSIGSLIVHLAAVETYYQVFTFEGRDFNSEEKEMWNAAMDLGDAARNKYKGNEVDYYLEKLKEVRKKTMQYLKDKDDDWLNDNPVGSSMNNHWAWFHVMEHQSSHLGQILLLRKRIK
jgi:uncharacterized damage-inducible protein DinB